MPLYPDSPPKSLNPIWALLILAGEIILSSVTILRKSRGYDVSGPSKELAIGWAVLVGVTALVCLIIGFCAVWQGLRRHTPVRGPGLIMMAAVAGLILVPVIASGQIQLMVVYVGVYIWGPQISF